MDLGDGHQRKRKKEREEYYSEKSEIMAFAATWMQQETLMLNEVSQTEKDEYHMTSLTCGI